MHNTGLDNTEKKIRLFGLIGYPLGHSFSKNYFTGKFDEAGITDCKYELFPLTNIDQLPHLINDNPNLCGLNVTIPYKQQVLQYLDDRTSLPMDACNCIKITGGKLAGFNTDVLGFEKSFLEKKTVHHQRALVLGTGGASVAVQYILQKNDIPFKVVSRSAGADLTYDDITAQIMAEYTIIVNTTPLGTFPDVHNCAPIPYEWINDRHYCYDLVYNPATTLFLEKSADNGAVIKNGADMLKIQADESWEIWNRV